MHIASASYDSQLSARILTRRPLVYTVPSEGSGPHVRATSGVCWLGDLLAMVQDDALFVALFDPATNIVQNIALPMRADGARLFDKERGNKAHKPDLEACIALTIDGAPALLGFGSGSHENREAIAFVRTERGVHHATLIAVPLLYAQLRALPGFLRNELNLEGAVLLGDTLRLFQRSNGTLLSGQTVSTCASCDLSLSALLAHLHDPQSPPPALHNVQHYDLGLLDGARLTITDATPLPNQTGLLFTASAERSPNAYDDGEVTGSALGKIDAHGVHLCALWNEQGEPVRDKAEGITLFRNDPTRAYVVFDPDDHRLPATLAEVELSGF